MRTQKDKNYKIKVNRASMEKNRSSPYNKYLKNDYKNIKKIDPKNPILYKVKYKPEIIINEYLQTSNNINIKTNRSGNSNSNNERNQYNNLGFQPNNIYFNDYNIEEYEFDNSIKNGDNDKNFNNNDKSDNQERAKNSDFISNKLNKSNESNSNEVIFSPFSNGYSIQSKESDPKRNKLKNNNNYGYNKKKPNYIFQSPIDSKNNKVNWNFPSKSDRNNYSHNKKNINRIEIEKNNIFNSKTKRNNSNSITKYDNDQNVNVCNALNYRKYNKRKDPVKSYANLYNKTVGSESSLDSFRAKKMNKMDNIVFSNINSLNNALKSGFNSNNIISNSTINFNSNNSNNIDNSKESLNLKLENYRTKLFKEFYKHFEAFYKSYVIKNFVYFMNKMKNYKKSIFNKKSFIYTKKNNLRKCFMMNNFSSYKKHKVPISINNKIDGNDLFEIKKTSTMKDYYKLYNELRKNRNLSQSMNKINNIFNSYSFDTDNNKYSNQKNNNKSVERRIKNDNILNSAPRLYKNLFNFSDRKNLENKNKLSKVSKSPNKIIINNVLCFTSDGKIETDDIPKEENKINKTVQTERRQKRYINTRDTRKISKPKNNNLNIHTLKDNFDDNDNNMKFNRTYYNNNFKNYNDRETNKTKSLNKNDKNKMAKTKKEVESNSKSNNNDYINLILKKINNIFNYKNNNYKNNNFKHNEDKKNSNEEYKKPKANNNNFIKKDNEKSYGKRWDNNNRIISNNNNNIVSILIKELSTTDKRINIRINYYDFIGKTKNSNNEYDFLQKSENNSLTLLGGSPESKKYPSKLNFRLSSIKEEENSIQNSKFYDENETLGNINENKKNYIIYHNNEIQVVNFIDAINNLLINIFKKDFMNNLKIYDKNNDNGKEENGDDNIRKDKNIN